MIFTNNSLIYCGLMKNFKRITYYKERLKEASLISILRILFIRFKKRVFNIYYNPLFRKFFLFFIRSNFSINSSINLRENLKKSTKKISSEEIFHLVMKDSFECLGYGAIKIPKNDAWLFDSVHDYKWELKYFNKIDFVAIDSKCDVKIPWELSRLQYLVILAYAFLEKRDQKILAKYSTIINNWINNNPPGYGVNWTCTMEVAIRMTNLSISYMILKDFLSSDQRKKIRNSLYDHRVYVNSFPELSDVPGNHYLSNLMGAFIIDSISQNKNKALSSLKTFTEEAQKQFLSDGCHFEMSPTYHRMCLEMVAIVTAFSLRVVSKENDVFKELIKIYKNGLSFCDNISTKNILPIFGDNDSGQIILFNTNVRDYQSLKHFYQLIKVKKADYQADYWTILLASIAKVNIKDHNELFNKSIKEIISFKGEGFISAKINDICAVMRYGPQGLQGRASHDHDDALQVWLSYKGNDILVDRGCHSYTLDKKIRESYILSSAHNVIKPFKEERYDGKMGSIVKTARGAYTANVAKSWNDKKDSAFLKASLKKNKSSKFLTNKREVQLLKQRNSYLLSIRDSWLLKNQKEIELNFFFSKFYYPKNIHRISKNKMVINFKNSTLEMDIKSNSFIQAKVFDFNFSDKYGFEEQCYGINIIAQKNKGFIESNFSIEY